MSDWTSIKTLVEFPRDSSGKETVRVEVLKRGSKHFISHRAYYQDTEGKERLGKGLVLSIDQLPRLARAYVRALVFAGVNHLLKKTKQ